MQLHLLWRARKKSSVATGHEQPLVDLPTITIQVPVYNERYVIARLLTALGALNYPKNLYDIQVLDDSTDDTSEIIRNSADLLTKQGVTVNILTRLNRSGFKGGALQVGLQQCRGQLIAIFDADFDPSPDFLHRMSVYFTDKKVGGVQGRWTHLNLYENPLTVIQAFLLDSHFSLEQRGRAAAGYFVNFNGTAGVWRKQCIIESGGWNGDVLTEDLELSYRAQLMGWKFMYDNQITVPAELPAEMNAFKTQQFRWAKGMAQTATKHLKSVANLEIPFSKKVHAGFHLLSSISFLAIMGNISMAAPILIARHYYPDFHQLSMLLLFTGITLPVLLVYYYNGTITTLPRKQFWKYLPLFLSVYSALSVQNSIAVLQGLLGHSSPFVRTPKLSGTSIKNYAEGEWTLINWAELLTACYILTIIIYSVYWSDYFLLPFLIMRLTGLLVLILPVIRLKIYRQQTQSTLGI